MPIVLRGKKSYSKDYLRHNNFSHTFLQVPRVFINGEFIGGAYEIMNLEKRGKLSALLSK